MSKGSSVEGKGLAGALIALVVGAVVWPVFQNWRENPKDDFPLSYYPMFSERRGKLTRVNYLVGLDAAGDERFLPYTLAGTGGLNQVRRQINRAIREGRERELAVAVASNVAHDKSFADVEVVRLVKGACRLSDYFAGHERPFSERVVAEAKVRREAEGVA